FFQAEDGIRDLIVTGVQTCALPIYAFAFGAHENEGPCKAHRYSGCADSLQTRKHLTDSERLLLGKTYFALQQFERAADALSKVRSEERRVGKEIGTVTGRSSRSDNA